MSRPATANRTERRGTTRPAGQADRAGVIAAARAVVLRGEHLELVALAERLGIGRATLYRWFGGREALLGEVMWSLAETTLGAAVDAEDEHTDRGLSRALEAFMTAVVSHPAIRHLLATEPETALRVLTRDDGRVQPRLSARIAALIETWCPQALMDGTPALDLAYAIVRVGESFCYADVIGRRQVDTRRAAAIHLRLLRPA